MFWGGILYGRRIALVHVSDPMTRQIHIYLIINTRGGGSQFCIYER